MRRRAHVHAPGGLRDDEQRGLGVYLAAHDEFLQIAARQRTGHRLRPAALDLVAGNDVFGLGLQAGPVQPATARDRLLARQHQVAGQRQGRHRTAPETLFGHKMQAQCAPPPGAQAAHVLVFDAHGPCSGPRVFTRQRHQQFFLAIARDTGNAHHFSSAHHEVNFLQRNAKLPGAGQIQLLHVQHHIARFDVPHIKRRGFAADHQAAERRVGLLPRVTHAGDLATAKHRAGRAQGANLMELVADVQNAAAPGRQLAQRDKQVFNRLWREHRSRLVKNQDLGVGQQRAHNLDPLPLAHAQRVDGPGRVQLKAVVAGGLQDALRDLGQAQALVEPEPDVFSHRERVKQAEVLKHHADAQRPRLVRVAHRHVLPINRHAARIGLDRAINDFHQR